MKNSLFNSRNKKEMFLGKQYAYTEYQCPVCKVWFKAYLDNRGVLLHVTRMGKQEAVAKALGEIKKIPHFTFWKRFTRPVLSVYNRREWIVV